MQRHAPFLILSHVTVWLRKNPVQVVLAGSQIALGTYARIHLRPSYTSCRISGSIHTTCLVRWQPRCATDISTNRRQSFFCRCTTSVEQAADRTKTTAFDGLVSSSSENISVLFCLQASEYGLTLWCALGLLAGGSIQVYQLQVQLQQRLDKEVAAEVEKMWYNRQVSGQRQATHCAHC